MLGVMAAGSLAPTPDHLILCRLLGGVAAIAGHTLSFWVRFRGGKGVATGLGVFLGLTPVASMCALLLFLGLLLIFRYVSLGSIGASAALPLFILYWGEGGPEWNARLAAMASLIAAFIIFKHRANVSRLLAGTENKVGAAPRQSAARRKGVA